MTRIATFKPILALGNADLEPEAAATFNVGAIVDRNRLFLSVDYWRYAFERPLVLEPYVRVLDEACPPALLLCDAGSAYFDRIDFGGRTAVSDISAVSVSVVNGPDVDTDGVDFKAEYVVPTGRGEWSVGFAGTRTLSWNISGWRFGPAYDAIGRLNYDTSLARTVVDWKAKAWLGARIGDVDLRWTLRHVAAYRHDGDAEARNRCPDHPRRDGSLDIGRRARRRRRDRGECHRRAAAARLPADQLRPVDPRPAGTDRPGWRALAAMMGVSA